MADADGSRTIDDETLERGLAAARDVRARAHAPYSRFTVGAAVVVGDGELHVGCNVESASYGLTLCAERSALAAMIAGGERGGDLGGRVVLVAISTGAEEPTPPCGACRQWLVEFAPDAIVVAEGGGGRREQWSVAELLPSPFTGQGLER